MDMEETIFGFGLVGFLLLCAFVWFRSLVAVDQRHPIVELAHVLGGLVGFLFRMVAKAFRGTKKLVVKLVKLVIEEDRFPLAAITVSGQLSTRQLLLTTSRNSMKRSSARRRSSTGRRSAGSRPNTRPNW